MKFRILFRFLLLVVDNANGVSIVFNKAGVVTVGGEGFTFEALVTYLFFVFFSYF